MNLLKQKTFWYAILVAIMSVSQGLVFELRLEPLHQMLIGCAIAIGIIVIKDEEGV